MGNVSLQISIVVETDSIRVLETTRGDTSGRRHFFARVVVLYGRTVQLQAETIAAGVCTSAALQECDLNLGHTTLDLKNCVVEYIYS